MGALGLEIELGTFLGTPPEVHTPIGSGLVFINTNDCGGYI